MGRISWDLMVTVDAKDRIIAATDKFLSMANVNSALLYHKSLKQVFISDSLEKAKKRQIRLQRKLLSLSRQNKNVWKPLFQTEFLDNDWKKPFIVDCNMRLSQKKGSVGLTTKTTNTYLNYKHPIDHLKHDIQWEIRFTYYSFTAISVFFNGWGECTDSKASSPNTVGYTLGMVPANGKRYSIVRMKRWNNEILSENVPRMQGGSLVTLRAEKTGGVFTLHINDKKMLEYSDPQFIQYCQYAHTGLIFSGFPVKLHGIKTYRRQCHVDYSRYSLGNFDLVFKDHPKQVYEAEVFYKRRQGQPLTDIYLRRVTELRKAQRANTRLLQQKEEALEQINGELKVAAKVLNSLLPKEFPDIKGLSFESYYHPSGHVGGDLFDVFPVNASEVAVLMYDVSGHGVPAALISVMTKTIFQKYFNSRLKLETQLNRMNAELHRNIEGLNFVTIFCGILNHKKRTLRYIGAGFVPPLILGQKHTAFLHTKGIPLGLRPKISSKAHTIRLKPGAKLILFTDGLFEIFNRKGELYSMKRSIKFLEQYSHQPLKPLITSLIQDHIEFLGPSQPRDDVSLLGIELK
jgi:serine phosphatase RsbU (regulator of sigma subunit)